MKVREKKKIRKKKRAALWLLVICIGCMVTAGCAKEQEDELVLLSEIQDGPDETENAKGLEVSTQAEDGKASESLTGQEGVASDPDGQDGTPSDPDGQEDTAASVGQDAVTDTKEPEIYVYVCGAVNQPGVYKLLSGARVYEAVELAGGLREDASASSVNQARKVEDGQKIYIPTAEEAEKGWTEEGFPNSAASAAGEKEQAEPVKVNINTATVEELMTLPGIGEAKAESIASYRQQHGLFGSIEELMKVEGIKDGVFDKIRERITV